MPSVACDLFASDTHPSYRQSGQGTSDELKSRDFKRELEEKERLVSIERESGKRGSGATSSKSHTSLPKKAKVDSLPAPSIDADEVDEEDDNESSSDESDEDDTAELLAELNRIKRERAQDEARKEAERKAQEEKIRCVKA